MSSSTLPDFEETVRLSQGLLDSAELAECHGLLCGLLCNGVAGSVDDYLDQLAAMRLLTTPEPALANVMADAWAATRSQMDDEDLGFSLWLPDDDEPLEERTVSLGQWCSGFLAGLGPGERPAG